MSAMSSAAEQQQQQQQQQEQSSVVAYEEAPSSSSDELSSDVPSSSSTTTLSSTNPEAGDSRVLTAVDDFLSSYCLSAFSKQIALQWMRQLSNDDSDLHRVKSWVLRRMNHVKTKPPGVSDWQRGCPELIPSLRSQAVWSPSEFPWVPALEAQFLTIREELLALRGTAGFQPYRAPSWASDNRAEDGVGSKSTDRGDWNVFYLSLHNMDFAANRARCPKTLAAVQAVPGQYDHCFFSALSPHSHITPHNGPTNKKLRCHLPLVVGGPNATMRVGDQRVALAEGKCLLFDDSFQHEAWNGDGTSRITLIFDVWHPDLSNKERKFLGFLQNAQMKAQKKVCEESGDTDNFFAIIDKAASLTVDEKEVWS